MSDRQHTLSKYRLLILPLFAVSSSNMAFRRLPMSVRTVARRGNTARAGSEMAWLALRLVANTSLCPKTADQLLASLDIVVLKRIVVATLPNSVSSSAESNFETHVG
jgi:hypothetical protein